MLESRLDEAKAAWEIRRTELQASLKELNDEKAGFEGQRSKLTEGLDPSTLQRYETLRKSKCGLAVAKVETCPCLLINNNGFVADVKRSYAAAAVGYYS